MNFFRFLLVVLLSYAFNLEAQDPTLPSLSEEQQFSNANQLYLTGKYAESAEAYAALFAKEPLSTPLLLNWGLASFQSGKRGLAVGLWRRALVIDPTFSEARSALAYATRSMQLRAPDDSLWLEGLRQKVLGHVSLNTMLGMTLIFLVLGGWPMVSYLGRRRKALQKELPLPELPWAGALLSLLFIGSLVMTTLKAVERSIPRGTAITSVSVRSGPSEASSSLFELREGSDVMLRQSKKGWTQIHDPGGMTGWVPEASLFQTSGMPIW